MLTPDDTALLKFEEQHPAHTGAKEEGIRLDFGVTAARYYQRLGALLADPEVIATHPQLASRRLRQRTASTARRAEISRLRRSA